MNECFIDRLGERVSVIGQHVRSSTPSVEKINQLIEVMGSDVICKNISYVSLSYVKICDLRCFYLY